MLVDGVDEHHVGVAFLAEAVRQRRGHVPFAELRHERQRTRLRGAVPDPDQPVFFRDRPRAGAHRKGWRAAEGRHVGAVAGTIEAPLVKEAAKLAPLHPPLGEMRAHVRTVGVECGDAAVVAAIDG